MDTASAQNVTSNFNTELHQNTNIYRSDTANNSFHHYVNPTSIASMFHSVVEKGTSNVTIVILAREGFISPSYPNAIKEDIIRNVTNYKGYQLFQTNSERKK